MIWVENFWYFGNMVAKERRSPTRGGRNWKFDCISKLTELLEEAGFLISVAYNLRSL